MGARTLTRRSFLVAGAGALAGALLRPSASTATETGRALRPRVSGRWLGEVPPEGRRFALERGADLLALEWQATGATQVQLRLMTADGRSSPWVPATGCGAGEPLSGTGQRSGRVIGAPIWVAGAPAFELRATRTLSAVRLHVIDAGGGRGADKLVTAAGALGSADAVPAGALLPLLGARQPPIIARSAWAQGMAPPRVAPAYGEVRMAFVHHSETPNGYLPGEVPAMLRSIYAFHRYVRGWNDIGYNFLIDAFGRIFEGRAGGIDEPVVGAQAGGYNLESTGVAVLGSFMSRPAPSAASRALQALLAWKLALHGVPATGRVRVRVDPAGAVFSRFPAGARVSLPRIAGHRDGDSTDCPGDALYHQLPGLRRGVQRMSARVARATLALAGGNASGPAQPGVTGPVPGAQPQASFAGKLMLLDGAPVAGAAIKLQARSVFRRGEVVRERTLGEVVTDAAGEWSLAAVPLARAREKLWLRALYEGGSGTPSGVAATVSQPLALPAALTR